jgi:DNA-binding response OmpR family regulator
MISVLIVEDDAFIRDITTIKFSEHDYEVVACASAEMALEALEARPFDVLLLDLDLPDMSVMTLN